MMSLNMTGFFDGVPYSLYVVIVMIYILYSTNNDEYFTFYLDFFITKMYDFYLIMNSVL